MQAERLIENNQIHKRSPIDLAPLEPVPVSSSEEITEKVRRARAAQPTWAALDFAERKARLTAACKKMLARRAEVVEIMRREAGKLPPEALMSEAIGPRDYLTQWAKVARPYLERRRLPINPFAMPGKSGYIDLLPRGVVGVIAPWNYPLANFFKPVFPALLCGNAVVMKPSEYTPRTGAWFHKIMAEHLPADVIACVQGDGAAGQAIVRAGIDALTFTGSVATGRAVLTLAAEQMIPCSVELGGKDPAIVLPDCNLDRTVAGVMNWALHNCGQNCGAIERVYVVDTNGFGDRFVEHLAGACARLKSGPPSEPVLDIGPMNNPKQLAIVEAHVADAVSKGAVVRAGGRRGAAGLWYEATVLDRCDHSMAVVSDETFGPVIAVVRTSDVEEAIRLANDSTFGLNASVWSENLERAEVIARRLEAGTVFVNNHALTGAMPFAPWTGVKQSGYGVANSSFALAHYTRPRTVLVDRNRKPDPWWFPLDRTLVDFAERLADVQLGRFGRALALPLILRQRAQAVLDLVRPSGTTKSLPGANGSPRA